MSDIIDEASKAAKSVWWLIIIRGVLAILMGIAALAAPLFSAVVATIAFGAYALVDGAVLIGHAVSRARAKRSWGWILAFGIVAAVAGLIAIIYPLATGLLGALTLLWIVAGWAIVQGIAGIAGAARLGEGHPRKGWNIAGGVITLIFGLVLIPLIVISPASTVLSLIWVLGVYAIVYGLFLLLLAFRLRGGAAAVRDEAERLTSERVEAERQAADRRGPETGTTASRDQGE